MAEMSQSENAKKSRNSKDLTVGPIFKGIMLYTIPIILTGVLQLLFNAADIIVVGNFASDTSLAAVSSTSSLINLIVNIMLGLSVGAGVCSARCFGAKNEKGVQEVLHTSIVISIVGGIVFGLIGFFLAKPLLVLMRSPINVIEQSTAYLKIYFIGVPFSVIYNFGAAILRSVGNTKQPLIFLIIAGVINVAFNLLFVIVLKMDVAGVAWATAISQFVSCLLVIIYLLRVKGAHRLCLKKLRVYKNKLIDVLVVGIPAGIQSSLFSLSNVIIQSSINSFGDVAMSGNGAACNIEGFIYTTMNSFHHTMLFYTGQHIGAHKIKRLKKVIVYCVISVTIIGACLGGLALIFKRQLLSIYAPNKNDVIEYGIVRMNLICSTYFICGIMDVISGALRGMGKSFGSMLIVLSCACGLRVVWIYTVFAFSRSLSTLYISYPVSWAVCSLLLLGYLILTLKKMNNSTKTFS